MNNQEIRIALPAALKMRAEQMASELCAQFDMLPHPIALKAFKKQLLRFGAVALRGWAGPNLADMSTIEKRLIAFHFDEIADEMESSNE